MALIQTSVIMLSVLSATAWGQGLDFLTLGLLAGDNFIDGDNAAGISMVMYNGLNNRVQALENRMAQAAPSGCESGVIGPFAPNQLTGTIKFQGKFDSPPAVSLSLSDLTSKDPAVALNFKIRPTQVTATEATVQVTDGTNNVVSAYVAYMACPSNRSGGTSGGSGDSDNGGK